MFAAAFRAAFHGRPADGVEVVRRAAEPRCPDTRWLLGVCLGALGDYEAARRVLLPDGGEPDPLCASARASHLRQLGRHTEAEALDRSAADRAATASHPRTALADALVGLVADAVGRADADTAAGRLVTAEEYVTRLPSSVQWRAQVRLAWVRAELHLLRGAPGAAHAAAGGALDRARAAGAPRHEAKSLLVSGVAAHVMGRADAAETLSAAAARADRLGLLPLVWPARLVLARALEATDPEGARRERAAARVAVAAIAAGLPAEEAAGFLAADGPASV